jgi:hypothetical protein
MLRRESLLLILLLAALAACGTATTSATQVISAPIATATTAARNPVSPAAPAPSAPSATPPSRLVSTPSLAPTGGPSPTATRPPAAASPAAPTAVPQPNGTLPPGWKVYRGPVEFPVVVAYPPDWTVNDSNLPGQRVIYLYGPEGREAVERIDIGVGQTQTGANIDVQRDQFFLLHSQFCGRKGIEFTEYRQVSGATFALLGATCDASNELSFMLVASGLTGGDEWDILMRTPYARKEARLREVFEPVLASLNIYARVP